MNEAAPDKSNPQTHAKPSVAILVDGTALFFGSRAAFPDRNLNYRALADILQRKSGGCWPPRPALFFSSVDSANEKQIKFVDFIAGELEWTVRQTPPHEATVGNPLLSEAPYKAIRFDAWISYALGRLAGSKEVARVFILTDSWPLAGPVRECASRGTPVTICFFGGMIDTRWHKVFRDSATEEMGVDFLDLDVHSEALFDRAKTARRSEEARLTELP